MDKPRRGGGRTIWIRFYWIYALFDVFFFYFITYLVVFSLCLAITMRQKSKILIRRRRTNISYFDKSG